ncbi:MAG TPA: aminoacyl-tRNA hydrolase [Candidatus Paceibacterota bacterium]|nr:aminoacyl-tRNA hydrolase [Candidatus Paceibacterota bacterium]
MVLIVGLGNPGEKYNRTRHNVGFKTIEEIAKIFDFPIFTSKPIFKAEISKGTYNNKNIVLAKPKTFMNLSGQAVKLLIKSFKTKELIVIHDDIDIPLGKIRIANNRGAANHNGVESIINELKTKNFIRLRIGIKPKIKIKALDRFVLQKFNKEEEKIVNEVIRKTAEAVVVIMCKGVTKAMNTYNK